MPSAREQPTLSPQSTSTQPAITIAIIACAAHRLAADPRLRRVLKLEDADPTVAEHVSPAANDEAVPSFGVQRHPIELLEPRSTRVRVDARGRDRLVMLQQLGRRRDVLLAGPGDHGRPEGASGVGKGDRMHLSGHVQPLKEQLEQLLVTREQLKGVDSYRNAVLRARHAGSAIVAISASKHGVLLDVRDVVVPGQHAATWPAVLPVESR